MVPLGPNAAIATRGNLRDHGLLRAQALERKPAGATETMARMIGIGGMAGGFLLISPPLRQSLSEAAASAYAWLNCYSPYSFMAVGVAGVAGLVCAFRSA